jgi:hypothetical protein
MHQILLDYTLSATFNRKTGRFQTDMTSASSYFDPTSKAERQMSYYFDYGKYQEERNMQKQMEMMKSKSGGGVQKKLTKKELDMFKQKTKEKKLRSLKKRFGDD